MPERADVQLLEDLLALEHRLVSAYEAALRRDAIEPSLGRALLAHEREHVRAIDQTLGSSPSRDPRASVPSPELTRALRDKQSFALYALDLEGHTVGAYADGVPRIRDASLRQPLGSIMVCGAAHVVALKYSLGRFLVN